MFLNGITLARKHYEGHSESAPTRRKENMLRYALIFLVIAIIAGILGFGGIAAASAGIAKLLFVVFLVLFVIGLIMHLARGGRSAI